MQVTETVKQTAVSKRDGTAITTTVIDGEVDSVKLELYDTSHRNWETVWIENARQLEGIRAAIDDTLAFLTRLAEAKADATE